MKILVAAQELRLDTTSEGICTAKYINALVAEGHSVRCVTADRLDQDQCGWLPSVAVEALDTERAQDPWSAVSRLCNRVAAGGDLGKQLDGKLNAAISFATGYSAHIWRKVSDWQHAIRHASRDVDVIITRAAGGRFEPHFAMLKLRLSVPWVANYHDPFPLSLYPDPYRERIPIRSAAQERLHRQILDRADALTFPSARLRDWVVADATAHRRKAFVVSHIGLDAGRPVPPDDRVFRIVHTGTMLRQRNPQGLLRGFLEFVGDDPDRQARCRLVLIGRIDKQHRDLPEWQALQRIGVVETIEHRIPFEAAVDANQRAVAVAIVEADTAISPFFPAKLADYLALRKPILALSPRASSTADILGPDYPLIVPPNDHAGIAVRLTRLWDAWRSGQLASFLPPEQCAAAVSVDAVRRQARAALEFVAAARSRNRQPVSALPTVAVRPSMDHR